jgi:hypothetical protein
MNGQKEKKYPSESLLRDTDYLWQCHEAFLANIPENAEALPIAAWPSYVEVGELFNTRRLVRRIVLGDIFAVVEKIS